MDYRTIALNIKEHVPDLSVIVIKQRINQRYQQIVKLRQWEYLKDDVLMSIPYSLNSGTSISTSYGATGVTASSGSPDFLSSHVGWWIRFGSEPQPYEVASVDSTTTVTLASNYSGTSVGLSGSSFTLFKAIHTTGVSVAEILGMVYDQPIRECSLAWLNSYDPERISTGQPERYAIVEQNRYRGRVKFQFWPVCDSTPYGVRVYYKQLVSNLSSDTDNPVCSPELLETWAIHDCYKIAAIKNPIYLQLAKEQWRSVRHHLSIEIENDLETATLPDKIRDLSAGRGINDDYRLDHDVDFTSDF